MTHWFRPCCRRPQWLLLVVARGTFAFLPSLAEAMSRPASDTALSPRLAELAQPSVQGLSHTAQARKLGVAVDGPGSLVREGGRVLVEVRFNQGAIAQLDALRAAGGKVLSASRRYQTATVAVPPEALHDLAKVNGAVSVDEVRAPVVYGASEVAAAAVGAECEGGSVVSEGAGPPQDQLHVTEARSKYGVNGGGITVGVLSDSYDKAAKAADGKTGIATHASEDVQSGDLPGGANSCTDEKTPVNVIQDLASSSGATDEGRAMLQVVHDVAPGADLAFATAFQGESSFAKNIEKLREAGANVIVDDVAYFEEPFFQDGPVAAAVDKVTSKGVSYFSSAGNDNLFEGEREIASWEAPSFRDTSCPPTVQALLPSTGHCMDFHPGGPTDNTLGITVEKGATLTVDLQWAEPWFGVDSDLDVYLLDSSGKLLAAEDQNNAGDLKPKSEEGGTQKPVEVLQWENTGGAVETRLAINRCFEACNPDASEVKAPRLKVGLLENGSGVSKTEYPAKAEGDVFGPTIFGHTAAAGAVSVAAIRYNNTERPERFSSRGPVKHFFGPVLDGEDEPAAAMPEEVIQKPDITATDCGATTFFATFVSSEATWRFCGTSAAAPHAAGVAALELDVDPALEPEEVREAQTENATSIGSFGADAIGAGLLDADGTIAGLLPPVPVTITAHPSSRTADSTPSISFESELSSPEFVCSIAGTEPCTSPYTVPASLPDGNYVFEVEVVGEAPPASFAFTVDTEAPVITITKRPSTPTSDPTPEFAFSTNEPASFTCAVDNGSAQPCTSPLALEALKDGPHSLTIKATDQVGNSSQKVIPFEVDTVAPGPVITETPPALSTDRRPSFAFSATEPVAFTCSIDDNIPLPCASPFEVPDPLFDGSHSFEVLATDLAGNQGRATVNFAIDATAPQTFISSHPRKFVRAPKRGIVGVLRFRSNESNVVLACKIDRGLWHFCRARIKRRFKPGRHTVTVKAQDEAGNVDPTPAVYRFIVRRRG
jgi:hypothetical protein